MKFSKLVITIEVILFMLVTIYLFMRSKDGTGATINLAVKSLSTLVWVIFSGLVAMVEYFTFFRNKK